MVAVDELSAWGVERLVGWVPSERGLVLPADSMGAVHPDVLRKFFDEMKTATTSNVSAVLEVWNALLPAVLSGDESRKKALAFYLDALHTADQIREGLNWNSLSMDTVGAGVFDHACSTSYFGEEMTPLQRAWRASVCPIIERLLDHGASPNQSRPETLIPEWTLCRSVNDLTHSLGPEWEGVRSRLRAVDLERDLPKAPPRSASPRF